MIEPAKIRDYLLSRSHPVGPYKAAFFATLGYAQGDWERLRDDLASLARTSIATLVEESRFGRMFSIDGMIVGPLAGSAAIRTLWIAAGDTSPPRFVTEYPR